MKLPGIEPKHNSTATLARKEGSSFTLVILDFTCCAGQRFEHRGVFIAMLSHRERMDAGKQPALNDGHAAPLIQILTWLFLVFSSLSIIAHFATKKAMSRPTTKGDLILLAALVSERARWHTHIADRYTAVPRRRTSSCPPEPRWPGNR